MSKKAKHKAVLDYIEGWEETHKKGDMSYEEAMELCFNTYPDPEYDKNGNYLGE